MALEGSLSDFGLADILQLIYFQRKSGILTLESKLDRVKLIFIDGNVSAAESKKRIEDNRVGKILLKKGVISEPDLQAALNEQRKTKAKLGNILVKNSIVKRELLIEILNSQITETVIQLFGWKQGTYEFTTQGVTQDKEMPFSIDTQHLLMEGLRIVDEWSLIRGKVNIDTVFRPKGPVTEGMTEDEREIFGYVDGENDVSTIIDLSNKDNFDVSKTLLGLLEKDLIEAAEPSPILEEVVLPKKKISLNFMLYLTQAAIVISVVVSALLINPGSVFREFTASKKIDRLRYGIEAYKLEHSSYPRDLKEIADTVDPWGRQFVYTLTDKSFHLSSKGADGIEGTRDDIY